MWCIVKKFIYSNKKKVVLFVILQIISAGVTLMIPLLNGKFVNILTYGYGINELIKYAMIIGIISILGILITYFYNILVVKIKNNGIFSLLSQVISHLQRINILEYEKFNPTYLNQRISDDSSAIINFFFDQVFSFFINSIKFFVLLSILFFINKIIFFISIIFIPIYLLSYYYIKNNLYNKSFSYKNGLNMFFDKVNDQLIINREIKVNNLYKSSEKALDGQYNIFFKTLMDYSKIAYLFASFDNFISVIFQVVVLFIGGIQVLNKEISLGDYTVINIYFNMLLLTMKFYINIGKDYQVVKVSIMRMRELLDIKKEDLGNILIDTVKQIYIRTNEKDILFESGNLYLIEGNNGIGKSTLINNIIGVTSTKLNIQYNNILINKIDLCHLRKEKLSIIIQNEKFPNEIFMNYLKFHLYNLLNEDELDYLINKKNLKEIFCNESFNIKEFYYKNLKEISGGEKQMLILFKGLIKDADVYIMDEAFSNIDENLKQKIYNYMMKLKKQKIIILISHSNKIKVIADKIISL